MDPRAKAAVIVVAAVGVVGLAAYAVHRRTKNYVRGVLSGESEPPCASDCTGDPSCTAFAFNKSDGTCVKYTTDPYSAWVEDPSWTLYVRRGEKDPASSWGDWSPQSCPKDCGPAVSQTRQCLGKCPGPKEKDCHRPMCPVSDRFGDGYYIPKGQGNPDPTNFGASSADECKSMSDSSSGYAWSYDSGAKLQGTECDVWTRPPTVLAYRPPVAGKPTAAGESIPYETGSGWGPMPDASKSCTCGGPSEIKRQCPSGSKCSQGLSTLKCTNVCAYDAFDGGHL